MDASNILNGVSKLLCLLHADEQTVCITCISCFNSFYFGNTHAAAEQIKGNSQDFTL